MAGAVNYQQVVERLLVWGSQPQRTNVGQRDLLRTIGAFIEDATLDEDAYRDFLRRFGAEVEEHVLSLLPDPDAIPQAMTSPGVTRAADHPPIEEDTSCRTPKHPPRPAPTPTTRPSRTPALAST